MAATTRQYTTIFAVGAKLLSSFKGVMNMAEQRLKKLQATSKQFMAGLGKLTTVFASFTAAVAGFSAAKIFEGLFEGAAEQAGNVEQRLLEMQFLLLKNAEIAKGGNDKAKQQLKLITDLNDKLGQQTVLSEEVYNAMTKQMLVAGVPPRQIMNSVRAMGDLLVATRGVQATEEQGAEMSKAITDAVFFGRAKKLNTFGVMITKEWLKEHPMWQERLDKIMEIAKFSKGAMAVQGATPLGRIVKFNNELARQRKLIGQEILPGQAEIADMWKKALPELRPAVVLVFKALLFVMKALASVVVNYLLPAFKRLQKLWHDQTPETQKRIKDIAKVVLLVGAAFTALAAIALPILAAIVFLIGSGIGEAALPVLGVLASIAASVIGMAVAWKFLGPIVTSVWSGIKDGASAMWDFLKAGWSALASIFVTIWQAVTPEISAIWTDIKTIASVFWDWFKIAAQAAKDAFVGAWNTVKPVLQPVFDMLRTTWASVHDAFVHAAPDIIQAVKDIGKAMLDWLLAPLRQFRAAFDAVAGAINEFRPTQGVPAAQLVNPPPPGFDVRPMTAAGRAAARAHAHAYQAGGIAKTPQTATLAEHGPEMVIPLNALAAGAKVQRENLAATKESNKLTEMLADQIRKLVDLLMPVAGAHVGGGGAFGGGGAGASFAAAAAATAPAQAAAAQMALSPEGLKAVQAERADIIAEMQKPEMRNLISATLATEATGVEDQKNVAEALVNRAVAEKQAGTYKGIEAMIKGGFYGPYKRGETAAVMSKGISDARYKQVGEMIGELGAGRNALGGLTDQGMINEIHGAIKERHGEDYYGLRKASEASTAAYKYSRHYARGGIASAAQFAMIGERGPEAVIPLRGGKRAAGLLDFANRALGMGAGPSVSTMHFAPNVTIHGNATESEQRAMDSRLRDLANDFLRQFTAAQRQSRRLSYEGGYG